MVEADITGLTAAAVAERVARGKVNRIRHSDLVEYREIVARNILTLFNALVVPAAIALFLLGEYPGAWSVTALATLNSAMGLVQEIRAKHHLRKLSLLIEGCVRVVRDGAVQVIPSREVVQGDFVRLSAGDTIVADGTVLESQFLEVDEGLLTGESDPIRRRPCDRVLSGSVCVAGEGAYRADKVGADAFAHHTTLRARAYRFTATPLLQSIDRLIKILLYTTVTLCAIFAISYFLRGAPATEEEQLERGRQLAQAIAATVTSMVPQGLVLMATVGMTLGAVRMAARGALVQRLSAVESMASVNVLCMDKTGTLTTNRLRLDRLQTLTKEVPEETLRQCLRLFAWTSVDNGNKNIQALRAALGESSTQPEVIDLLPFKSQNRYSAVRIRDQKEERVLVLGAYEELRPHLAHMLVKDCEVAWTKLLGTGLRLLLFAEVRPLAPLFQDSLEGFSLQPLALVALSDELRKEAGEVLKSLTDQGIDLKILSGDNPDTVRATVGHLDLALARKPVVSGDQLAQAPNRAELIRSRCVFGRVTPEQKVEIVTTLQQAGCHVAMLGDGVNDVLSIKKADLGIAMGEGSAASKTVSGLVLQNNNFALLPSTLDEGRIILNNLRRSAKLFLTKNVYSLLLILGALFGQTFPYVPEQVTLLNALTIGIPAFVIALSKERSLAASGPGLLREVGRFVLPTGSTIGAGGLVMLQLARRYGDPRMERTLLLSALVLLGLGTLLRTLTNAEARPASGKLWLMLAPGAALVYLAAIYIPQAADFFELVPLTWAQWALVLAVALPGIALCKLLDWLVPRSERSGVRNPRCR
jgi:cation-transporting ATPase E